MNDIKESKDSKKSMFALYFRTGNNPHAQFRFFFAEGEFRSIIERCKKHCELMNYRFVTCCPAIIDFDTEEKRQLGQ